MNYQCTRGHGNVGYSEQGQCLQCNRDRKNEWQNQHLYGWTLAERDAELVTQGGACAICGRTGLKWGKGFNDVWHVDHVHGQEGTHRGILCATCNLALGKLESHMGKVLEYLAKHKRKLSDGNLDSNDTGHN